MWEMVVQDSGARIAALGYPRDEQLEVSAKGVVQHTRSIGYAALSITITWHSNGASSLMSSLLYVERVSPSLIVVFIKSPRIHWPHPVIVVLHPPLVDSDRFLI